MTQAEILRSRAENCVTLQEAASTHAARQRFERMTSAWHALAEAQDWLDGSISPVQDGPELRNQRDMGSVALDNLKELHNG